MIQVKLETVHLMRCIKNVLFKELTVIMYMQTRYYESFSERTAFPLKI